MRHPRGFTGSNLTSICHIIDITFIAAVCLIFLETGFLFILLVAHALYAHAPFALACGAERIDSIVLIKTL